MKILYGIAFIGSFLLAGCQTPAQQATLQTSIATACRAATIAEAADPSLTSHNQKVAAGVTTICAVAPSVATILSAPPASALPPAVIVPPSTN